MFASWRRDLGWWVLLVPLGIALSIAAGVSVAMRAPATYTANRQILFLAKPTSAPELGFEINPFLNLGSSLYTAASVVAISVTDERATKDILGIDPMAEYTVTEQPGGSTPVLNIETLAPTPEMADQVADEVVARVSKELKRQQKAAKAPVPTWIVSSLIASSLGPHRVWKKNIVYGAAAAAAVLMAFAVLLLLIVAIKRAWRARRARRAERAAARAALAAEKAQGTEPAQATEPNAPADAAASPDTTSPDTTVPASPDASAEPARAGDPGEVATQPKGAHAPPGPEDVTPGQEVDPPKDTLTEDPLPGTAAAAEGVGPEPVLASSAQASGKHNP